MLKEFVCNELKKNELMEVNGGGYVPIIPTPLPIVPYLIPKFIAKLFS